MIEPRNKYKFRKVDSVGSLESNIIESDNDKLAITSSGSKSQACYTMIIQQLRRPYCSPPKEYDRQLIIRENVKRLIGGWII